MEKKLLRLRGVFMKYEMWRRGTRNYGPVHLSIPTEDVLRDANAERQDGSLGGGGAVSLPFILVKISITQIFVA